MRILAAADYTYELRDDGRIVSTGRVRLEAPVVPGMVVRITGAPAEVVEVIPQPEGPRLLLRR
jgi:hypothetical protein